MPLWLSDPTSYSFLHALDFWIGTVGFAITIATFVLGWRKLARVQLAADAAEKAVKEVKLRVGRYDATVDASEGLFSCNEMIRFLDGSDWRAVVQSMMAVRLAIIRMDAQITAVNEIAADELRRASQRLDKQIKFIEAAVSRGTALPNDHVIRLTIRMCQEAFVKAKHTLEDRLA